VETLNLVIILPTYNERENIQALIPALQEQLRVVPYRAHILVVDDNSPDGTGEAVRLLMRECMNLHLITGEKQGLGAAYIRGMQHALEVLSADVVVEMDADLSHDPADLPRLLETLDLPADFVIGSRYVPGGSIPSTWGWHRRANSRLGNLVARYVAGLYQVRDCTAGYRAIRSSVLREIDFSTLRVKGYAFQIALLHRAVRLGARVAEIPVHFADRKLGDSKLGLSDIIEFLVNAWWIRLWSARTFIKFCIVGATGVAVNLAAFSALLACGTNPFVASPIAVELSILWNFFLNNAWTFRYRPKSEHIGIRGLKFNVVSLASLAVTFGTFVILSQLFPKLPLQVDQLAAILPTTAINYFLNSYWTFKHQVTGRDFPSEVTANSPTPDAVQNRSTLT
jgi:dolichol-phosphate mannosyltransferase